VGPAVGTAVVEPAGSDVAHEDARPGPQRGSAWVWFAVSATVLVGLAPTLVMGSTPLSERSSDAWPWAWLVTLLVGLRYAWVVAVAPSRLYELIVWLFTYVFLGLAALAQMRSGTYPGTTPDLDTSLNATTMAVIGVGAAAFGVGLLLGPGQRERFRQPAPRMSNHRLLFFTALVLLFSAWYASRVGIGTLFTTRAERTAVEEITFGDPTVRAVIKAAATLPLVVAFSGLVRLRRQREQEGRRGPVMLTGLVLVVMVIVISPVSSPRYLFGTAALAVVVALGATTTTARTRWFALLLAAGLVLVFPYADATRRPGPGAELSGPAQALSSSDFDAFDQVNNAVAYVQAEGTTQGGQALGAALFWVPRSIWAGKPQDTGVLLADFREYTFSNLSAPLWAELFINGGWPVLVLGMAALGVLVRRLDGGPVTDGRGRHGGGVLADILPFYFIIMLRGSLLQSMAGFAVLAASGLFVSERHRRSR
jgi:hypothetical protein